MADPQDVESVRVLDKILPLASKRFDRAETGAQETPSQRGAKEDQSAGATKDTKDAHFSAKAGLAAARKRLGADVSHTPLVFIRAQSCSIRVGEKGLVAAVCVSAWMYGFQNPSTLEVTAVTVQARGTTELETTRNTDRLVPLDEPLTLDINDVVRAIEAVRPPRTVDLGMIGRDVPPIELGTFTVGAHGAARSREGWKVPVWEPGHELHSKHELAFVDTRNGIAELLPNDATVTLTVWRAEESGVGPGATESLNPSRPTATAQAGNVRFYLTECPPGQIPEDLLVSGLWNNRTVQWDPAKLEEARLYLVGVERDATPPDESLTDFAFTSPIGFRILGPTLKKSFSQKRTEFFAHGVFFPAQQPLVLWDGMVRWIWDTGVELRPLLGQGDLSFGALAEKSDPFVQPLIAPLLRGTEIETQALVQDHKIRSLRKLFRVKGGEAFSMQFGMDAINTTRNDGWNGRKIRLSAEISASRTAPKGDHYFRIIHRAKWDDGTLYKERVIRITVN